MRQRPLTPYQVTLQSEINRINTNMAKIRETLGRLGVDESRIPALDAYRDLYETAQATGNITKSGNISRSAKAVRVLGKKVQRIKKHGGISLKEILKTYAPDTYYNEMDTDSAMVSIEELMDTAFHNAETIWLIQHKLDYIYSYKELAPGAIDIMHQSHKTWSDLEYVGNCIRKIMEHDPAKLAEMGYLADPTPKE